MGPLRILLVDDHEALRRGVRSFLALHKDWEVCGEAVDGVEAVDQTRELRPDIVLMDISMPRMNGLQATRIIRRDVPESMVVILSQNDSTIGRQQAREVDAAAYVAKSDLPTNLIPTLERVVTKDLAPGTISGDQGSFFLPENEKYFRQIIDLLPAAVYTTDGEGRLTHFNRAAVDLSGRVPQLGTDRWCVSWKMFHPDGKRLWFTPFPRPVRNAEGKIVGGVNMLIDITERKQAERAGGLLASIVDSSDDAIISKSLDGIITSWNKGAERLFGYTSDEAIGRHISLIIPVDRLNEEATIIERLQRGDRVNHFETRRKRKDGTSIDISLTISPVKDASGRVVGASKVARDITQRKQAERDFRSLAESLEAQVHARTEELEQRNRDVVKQSEQLRDLSYRLIQTQDDERRRIARELHDSAGQTLTALGMTLSRLTEKARLNDPKLADEAAEVEQLVQDLSKEIRTTSYLLHPPLLDECGLYEALQWYIPGLKERSGLEITLDIPRDFGRLTPESELTIFRIVQECLTNIHRHSGSKVAGITIVRNSDHVSLEVRDEGSGIPAGKLIQLQSSGAGVGIRGMRERALQLGGQLHIQSDHYGTKISISLPIPRTVDTAPEYARESQPAD